MGVGGEGAGVRGGSGEAGGAGGEGEREGLVRSQGSAELVGVGIARRGVYVSAPQGFGWDVR